MPKGLMLIRVNNWQLLFLYQLRHFPNRNLWYTFQTLFALKRGLVHPYFLYENESLQHCLSYDMKQMATFLGLVVQLFERAPFFSGPGSRCHRKYSLP